MYIAAIFVFLIGLCFGSFLNVVIYRYNTGRSINGRSGCMTCNRTLAWYELIPVGSFLVQKGRCRGCSSKLSWQYPLVELFTGVLFLATFVRYFNIVWDITVYIDLVIMLMAWCLLVVIIVYDFKHKIIPDGFAYTFAALGLLRIAFFVPTSPSYIFYLTLLAGPLLFLPFYLLWLVSDGKWIGLGDGKLALGIGWMLGLGYGVSAIVLAFWTGAIISVACMVIMQLKSEKKQLTMKSEIPFAPFLILGFTIVYFFAVDVFGLHTMFGI
jgi:prepilin signal peptidase PulO-like enzyme (type II secretory pathway)